MATISTINTAPFSSNSKPIEHRKGLDKKPVSPSDLTGSRQSKGKGIKQLEEKIILLSEKVNKQRMTIGNYKGFIKGLNQEDPEIVWNREINERIATLEGQIKGLKGEVWQKDTEIEGKNKEITDLKEAKQAEIEDKDQEIEGQKRAIREQRAVIRQKDKEVEGKNKEITDLKEAKQAEIEDKDQEIERQKSAIREQRAVIRQKNIEIEDKNKEITDLNSNGSLRETTFFRKIIGFIALSVSAPLELICRPIVWIWRNLGN